MARTWAPRMELLALVCACAWQGQALASVTAPPAPRPTPQVAAPQASGPPTQDAEADAPVSPADLAKARARADAVIAKAHAEAYFTNITDGAAPKVRHKASGMECVFGVDDPAFLYIYSTPGVVQGEDVSCSSASTLGNGETIVLTLYATRPPKLDDLQPLLDRMVSELKSDMPDAAPSPDRFTSLNLAAKKGADVPTHRSARFQATEQGHPVFARAAVGVVNGWEVSQRTTAPLNEAHAADTMSEVILGVAMADVFYAKTDTAAP